MGWTWEDGSTYSYSHWHSGEPNDSGSAEDCVEANWVDLNWNDLGCSASRQAVYILPTDFTKNKACEWYIEPEKEGSCEVNEYEVKGVGCLPKLDRGGKTMVYMHQKKSIKTAEHQALAEDCGGHLASVLSNTEQKQMDDMKIKGSLLIGLTQPSSCRSEPKGCWTWD